MSHYFFKYHGAGNDFILFDDRNGHFPESQELVQHLCHRRFGIGSDGIMLIKHSEVADVHLDFINPDGSRSFCGNGSRCGLRFAESLGMIGSTCSFEAIDGIHQGELTQDVVRISMRDVGEIRKHEKGDILDTGSPHLIIRHENLTELDVNAKGSEIRYSPEFEKEGINVNFIESVDNKTIRIRTYERGVEGETLSCGTGVTAAALAFAEANGITDGRVGVHSRGGDLSVEFKKEDGVFTSIWLIGPAEKVYAGEIHL